MARRRAATFVRFVEYQPGKGGPWTFWLEENGNTAALARLREAVDAAGADSDEYPYRMGDDRLREREVDLLVDNAVDDGYWSSHVKVSGRLVLPEGFDTWDHDPNSFDDPLDKVLYKGGIFGLFHPEAANP